MFKVCQHKAPQREHGLEVQGRRPLSGGLNAEEVGVTGKHSECPGRWTMKRTHSKPPKRVRECQIHRKANPPNLLAWQMLHLNLAGLRSLASVCAE